MNLKCIVCKKRATKKCSNCLITTYCGQKCQHIHWKIRGHSKRCNQILSIGGSKRKRNPCHNDKDLITLDEVPEIHFDLWVGKIMYCFDIVALVQWVVGSTNNLYLPSEIWRYTDLDLDSVRRPRNPINNLPLSNDELDRLLEAYNNYIQMFPDQALPEEPVINEPFPPIIYRLVIEDEFINIIDPIQNETIIQALTRMINENEEPPTTYYVDPLDERWDSSHYAIASGAWYNTNDLYGISVSNPDSDLFNEFEIDSEFTDNLEEENRGGDFTYKYNGYSIVIEPLISVKIINEANIDMQWTNDQAPIYPIEIPANLAMRHVDEELEKRAIDAYAKKYWPIKWNINNPSQYYLEIAYSSRPEESLIIYDIIISPYEEIIEPLQRFFQEDENEIIDITITVKKKAPIYRLHINNHYRSSIITPIENETIHDALNRMIKEELKHAKSSYNDPFYHVWDTRAYGWGDGWWSKNGAQMTQNTKVDASDLLQYHDFTDPPPKGIFGDVFTYQFDWDIRYETNIFVNVINTTSIKLKWANDVPQINNVRIPEQIVDHKNRLSGNFYQVLLNAYATDYWPIAASWNNVKDINMYELYIDYNDEDVEPQILDDITTSPYQQIIAGLEYMDRSDDDDVNITVTIRLRP